MVILGMTLVLPVAIGLQMVRIQLLEGSSLRSLWDSQAIDMIAIPAQRGQILDSRERILVSNTVSYSVAIDPHAPNTKTDAINSILQTLSEQTKVPVSTYRSRINQAPSNSRYIVLERNVDRSTYNALRALGIRNVILEERFRRRYNYDHLGSHVIGYVNHEIRGMMGLESAYDHVLRGTDGQQQVQRDRLGRIRAMVGAPRRQPVQGHTLVTTIDAHIQAIVEEELRTGVIQSRARYGTVIVLDPSTGAIKAMANYPSFNPNSPASDPSENRRNFAISDMIEPGSTFKLVTAVAAVEQNAVKFDEVFHTPSNGVKMIHGQAMRDHDPLGSLDFNNVIKKSSNIATSEIAMRLNKETFYQYARNLGFGSPTGIDLSSEESGRMQKPFNWSNVTLPWMSIGYEVQVTPLQMVMAYGAFANNGNLMKPYIVEEIRDEHGRTIQKTKPTRIRRAIKPETIQKLMPAFEGVVTEDGTAEFARIEGITIGGKTGTAQKFIDGRYQARYRASFVGFYPTNDPRYVVLVLIDEPRTSIYGGFISGPIFRRITTRIMGKDEYLQKDIVDPVLADGSRKMPQLIGMRKETAAKLISELGIRYELTGNGNAVIEQYPARGEKVTAGSRARLTLGDVKIAVSEHHRVVPDLNGLSMRQAAHKLTEAGFKPNIIGSGTVYAQFPRAGENVRLNQEITVRGRARSMNELITYHTTRQ